MKRSAVSTIDGWLTLNFASCALRQTRSLGVFVLCSNWNMVFVNYIYDDIVIDTQFHKFHGRPFARVLYLLLMKGIGRCLPWVLPGSTGRFYKDDVVHHHSAHGYYITRKEGAVRHAWYCSSCYMLKQIERKLSKNCHPHILYEVPGRIVGVCRFCSSKKSSKTAVPGSLIPGRLQVPVPRKKFL